MLNIKRGNGKAGRGHGIKIAGIGNQVKIKVALRK